MCNRFHLLVFLILSCVFIGCQTPKAVVVFSSDIPASIEEFKEELDPSFIGSRKKYVQYSGDLEKKWLDRAIARKFNSKLLKIQLSSNAYTLKRNYLSDRNRGREPNRRIRKQAWRFFLTAQKKLHNSFEATDEYIDLLFWSALSLRNDSKKFRKIASLYSSSVTTKKVNQLENGSLVDIELIQKIYLAEGRQVYLRFSGNKDCSVFVNGNKIRYKKTKVPRGIKSVVTAKCENGYWARSIIPYASKKLTVEPKFHYYFEDMPNTNLLGSDDILSLDSEIGKILFVHYSNQRNKIYLKGFKLKPYDTNRIKYEEIETESKNIVSRRIERYVTDLLYKDEFKQVGH